MRKPDPQYLFLNVHRDTESANLQMQEPEIRLLSFCLITNANHAFLVTRYNCPAAQSLTLHL